MLVWIAVGLGGALGAVARHGVNGLVHQHWPLLRFPLATVVVNILGCCPFGLLAGAVASGRVPISVYWRELSLCSPLWWESERKFVVHRLDVRRQDAESGIRDRQ
jgi:hypothetical protein